MKKLIPLIALLFLTGCSVGKIIIVEIENEAEGTGKIENKLGSLSTISGDNENTQKDFAKLPFDELIGLVRSYISKGESIPENLIDAIVAKKNSGEVVEEPDTEEEVSVDKKKLPITVKTVGPIHIDGKYPMRYVVDGVCGPDLGEKFKITFNDGRELYITNSKKDSNTTAGRGYRPGCDYTYHKDVKWMEVYDDPGKNSESITITAM